MDLIGLLAFQHSLVSPSSSTVVHQLVLLYMFNTSPPPPAIFSIVNLIIDFARLIPDHMCTTVHHSLAAYDRIVVHGDEFYSVVAPGSGRVFRYNEDPDFKPIDQGEGSCKYLERPPGGVAQLIKHSPVSLTCHIGCQDLNPDTTKEFF